MLAASGAAAFAQKAHAPGASDAEIKIGNIMAYSGSAGAYGVIGKAEEAYFKMINDQGGINGRKINFISYDDAYSPPKTVEQVRKLVESDEVLLTFGILGTPGNSAIQKYLNAKQVPQLFVASGATKWGQPGQFPWTMGWQPSYQNEGRIFAKYILQAKSTPRIGVLYQNDEFGKDLLQGLQAGLNEAEKKRPSNQPAPMVVLEAYEVSEPTIDAHVARLQQTGADVFVSFATPKFAAQAIRKIAGTGWKPLYLQTSISSSVGGVMRPAGYDASQGIISAAYLKDASDPEWKNDSGMQDYRSFLQNYYPDADATDNSVLYGYAVARTLVQVLKQAGNNLTRTNIMAQAANLRGWRNDVLLPGVTINTAANDFFPIEQMQLMRFKGEKWELFGDVMGGELDGRSSAAVIEAKLPASSVQVAPQPPPPPVAHVAPPAASNVAALAGRRVALVVGNASYRYMPSLTNPRNDATDVESALKGLGFETILATDLDRSGMNNAMERFSRLVPGASVAMVYYSGHGMQFEGKNYLLPVDASLESAGDVNRYRLMPLDDLVDVLRSGSGLQLIVLDACRNNPIERDFKNKVASLPGGNRDAASTRGFARIDARNGLIITYATAPDSVASDGNGRNSPFTQAFLKNVAVSNVEVRQMLYQVQSDVYTASEAKQLPEISSLYVGPPVRLKTTK
jgi:branched-chain amino acid transport system substrate-binding protein